MKYVRDHIDFLQSQLNCATASVSDSTDRLLYYYTLCQIEYNQQHVKLATFYLEKLISKIIDGKQDSLRALFLIEEFKKEGILTSKMENQLLAVDYYLYRQAKELISQDNFEDIYRATEISYYFTKRQSDTYARQYLQSLLSMMFPKAKKHYTSRFIVNNVSVGMNGLSGCLLMLVYIALSTNNAALKSEIKEELRFLISLRREVDFSKKIYFYFPSNTQDERFAEDRLAWNDSDLAPTILLYQAALLYHDVKLANMAELTGLNTLLRKNDVCDSVNNPDFYQGTAGIAHTYQTLYRISSQYAYKEGCTFWTQRTISLLERHVYNSTESNLLFGITGILLPLLSTITDKELLWDKSVLLRN